MEAVGQLAGGIAHDFNNMLTAISGYAELLAYSFEDGDPRADDVDQVRKAAAHAAALTRQLLAFSRKQVLLPQRARRQHRSSRPAADARPHDRRRGGAEDLARGRARARRDRPGPARAGGAQHGAQRPRRDADRWVADDHDERRRSRQLPVRLRRGHRHGHRHGRGDSRPCVRALLHDEGHRQGHGARPRDRIRLRQPERRQDRDRHHARRRLDRPRAASGRR